MLRQLLLGGAALVALLAVFFSRQGASTVPKTLPLPGIPGRNNTVLFLTCAHNGLSNVHVATTFSLMEKYPELEVHYGSFGRLASELERVSAAAKAKNPAAGAVVWHEMPGIDYTEAILDAVGGNIGDIMGAPGVAGLDILEKVMAPGLSPWTKEQHWELYQAILSLIEEVDPAVIVLDPLLRPGMDMMHNLDRSFVVITPNAMTDLLAGVQPWGAMFWKYSPLGSGIPYPIPWSKIPNAIYLQYRMIKLFLTVPGVSEKKAFLSEKGVNNPLAILDIPGENELWLAMSFPESGAPLDVIPPFFKPVGPLVLDVAPAEEQDPELAAWLKNAPTMLINLGSAYRYSEKQAKSVIEALSPVLEKTNTQVLWKFRKLGEFDDSFKKPLETYIASGRLKIVDWLNVDPTSLLQTGDIAVSVHHGGANCYYEAIMAGIPHVILPMWMDLYNFAVSAEYLGVGVWPSKATAPSWDPKELGEGFMQALTGESSVTMREKAKALAEVAASYGGRDAAAAEVARLAARGI